MADVALSGKTMDVYFYMKAIQGSNSISDTMTIDSRTVIGEERHLFVLTSTTTMATAIINIKPSNTKAAANRARVVFMTADKHCHLRHSTAGGAATAIGSKIKGDGFYLACISDAGTRIYIDCMESNVTTTGTVVANWVSWS
jgi:hypothetical protein